MWSRWSNVGTGVMKISVRWLMFLGFFYLLQNWNIPLVADFHWFLFQNHLDIHLVLTLTLYILTHLFDDFHDDWKVLSGMPEMNVCVCVLMQFGVNEL